MLSKEEIEKAKEILNWVTLNKFYIDLHNEMDYHKVYNSIETLLQYIDQLEQENKDAYWKGHIQKQNEAVEICKICKYRKQYLERNKNKYE